MSVRDTAPRWLELEGAANARVVVPGVLLRSDNLQSLSDGDVRGLIDEQRLELVLDLRTDVEVAREGPGPLTDEPTVRVEHRSLHPDRGEGTDLKASTVRPWGEGELTDDPDEPQVVRSYLSYLRRRPDSVVAAVAGIARAQGAVLVHCAAGKDRTGVVIALALAAVGAPTAWIVADYAASGQRGEAILARLLASATYHDELVGLDPRELVSGPETMERFLEVLDRRHGGAAAWLTAHGLSDADLAALRRRLAPDD